jgi:hypothetical protein
LHHEQYSSAYFGLKKIILQATALNEENIQLIIITGRGLHSQAYYHPSNTPMHQASKQVCKDLLENGKYAILNEPLYGSFLLTFQNVEFKKRQSMLAVASTPTSQIPTIATNLELTLTSCNEEKNIPVSLKENLQKTQLVAPKSSVDIIRKNAEIKPIIPRGKNNKHSRHRKKTNLATPEKLMPASKNLSPFILPKKSCNNTCTKIQKNIQSWMSYFFSTSKIPKDEAVKTTATTGSSAIFTQHKKSL